MATRIRLQRHGKKGKAFFHLVAADSRAKRDGRFIEKLGTYNPVANPAVIDINFDNTLAWVQKGAEMSETARAILSYKGVLHKNHLLKGVAKGALTLEQAEAKFTQWLQEKDGKIEGKKDSLSKSASKEKANRMKAEVEANIAKAAMIEAKNTVIEEEVVADEAVSEEVVSDESVSDEVVAEEAVADEAVAEEAVAEEVVAEEAVAEEVVAEETPEADESSAEEAPAAE
jgi:small subunit ribosomal protein S16